MIVKIVNYSFGKLYICLKVFWDSLLISPYILMIESLFMGLKCKLNELKIKMIINIVIHDVIIDIINFRDIFINSFDANVVI